MVSSPLVPRALFAALLALPTALLAQEEAPTAEAAENSTAEAAQSTPAEAGEIPAAPEETAAEGPAAEADEFRWERWLALSPAEPGLEPGGLLLRVDCDSEALYLRYEIEAWLPYREFTEGQPAWRFDLQLSETAAEGQPAVYLDLSVEDDSRRDYELDNGVRVLETEEQDGSQRIELRIPRTLLGENVVWGAAGPSVALAVTPLFELANRATGNDNDAGVLVEVVLEEIPAEDGEGSGQTEPDPEEQASAEPNVWPDGYRFSIGWDGGEAQSAMLPAFGG